MDTLNTRLFIFSGLTFIDNTRTIMYTRFHAKELVLSKNSVQLYTRYPLLNIFTYNGTTIIHYLLGGTGIILGYTTWIGYLIGILYIVFSFVEMYVHMPFRLLKNNSAR